MSCRASRVLTASRQAVADPLKLQDVSTSTAVALVLRAARPGTGHVH